MCLDSKDLILKIVHRKKLSPVGHMDSTSLVFVRLGVWYTYLEHFSCIVQGSAACLEMSADWQCPVLSAE